MGKISIYQIFTRLFGNSNSHGVINGSIEQNGVGKMNDITDKALQEIKYLGITHIWYTGIIEHATCMDYPDFHIKSQNPLTIKGRAGSPYAITDYWDVNPYLAVQVDKRMEEFEHLVARTHKNDLKVIIDFVPNHVARTYGSDVFPEKDFGIDDDKEISFSPNNDYYYIPGERLIFNEGMGTLLPSDNIEAYIEYPAKATGNDQFHAYPTLNDWYETVKLNYGIDYLREGTKYFEPIPSLWNKMLEILMYWASKNIDAFRCDMAEMVPVEFWHFAISKVKQKYPNLIFIAEVYDPALYEQYLNVGLFDYLYDKVGLYDSLRQILNNNASASQITSCWQNLNGIDSHMLRFLENHDEHRIASTNFADDPTKAIPAMLVSATLNTGPVMVYFGQEVGEPAHGVSGYSGDDGKTSIFDFWGVPEHQKWMNFGKFDGGLLDVKQQSLRQVYAEILNLSISEKAVAHGKFYDLMWVNHFDGGPDHRFIYSYLRYCQSQCLLFVACFDNHHSHDFRLKIPEHAFKLMQLNEAGLINFNPIFGSENQQTISGFEIINQGANMLLEPNSAVVYRLE